MSATRSTRTYLSLPFCTMLHGCSGMELSYTDLIQSICGRYSQFCYLFNAPLLILTCILQDDERVACIALHILIHYFMVATYMWMLAEGMNDFMIHFFSISVPPMTLLDVRACPSSLANNWFFENYHSRSLFIHCIGRDICVRKTRQTRPLYAGMGSALLSHLGLSHRSWSFQ